jgi:hypothetical protein
MSALDVHDDWLSLIEISGPFLAVPVLKDAFPQGLEGLDDIKRKRFRQAYEEWREALELEDAQFAELHAAWIEEVLSRGLELDEDGKGNVLKRGDWCAANLNASIHEQGLKLSPHLAVVDEQRANKPLMLVQTYAQDVDLNATLKQDGWVATPADRMVALCRSLGCRLGLVTNGERWMLVDAPVGAVTTFASWYARIWTQEPITLQAFVHLLGIRRFFVDESEQLPALFDQSLKFQDEVTDALGEQVRRAVEVLIQALDKADQDRNRELLHDVKESELYEAALTVMMRLVFLLSAEERGLLLIGEERYEANYAVSTLRMHLRKESEEILERRWDAWSRLLAIFRAVFGGIEHENLRLPALGGSLFDPDRFPFLEGRYKGSNWRSDAAKPLPIDNRTVLLLLDAIQQFKGRTLSYRALDVEQIGYVYEGLLERTVKRTDEATLELDATKSAKTPWVKLAELDSAQLDGASPQGSSRLAELLQERSGISASRVRNDLSKIVDDTLADRLLTACQGDTKLRDRVKPYAHLLRTDPWGYPLVYPTGTFIVTTGSDRRETGTHYTPKSLTEAIVAATLTPLAYVGPAEGTPRDKWALKSPVELLDLKICDPAMGSGAFLVQACRWLSDRLVEAWSQVENSGKTVSVDGEVLDARAANELLSRDSEARTVIARRLIAERCLYGVDLNPLAVELAKLSIWLLTLAKGRPFGFLDHNLRWGDSLLGIHRLDQLTELSMAPTGKGQQRLFGQNIERAVREAIELRQHLREMPIRDIRDVEAMAQLDTDARQKLAVPELIADAFIGEVLVSGGNGSALENGLASLTIQAGQAVDCDHVALDSLCRRSTAALLIDQSADKQVRRPFHWPLEFPEVFTNGGFNGVIGNPPFMWGNRISIRLGYKYRSWLQTIHVEAQGQTDLSAHFLRRAFAILIPQGALGLIATNSISETDTLKGGLLPIVKNGGVIYRASSDDPWPGAAGVRIATIYIRKGEFSGEKNLNGVKVESIAPDLSSGPLSALPNRLKENFDKGFKGVDFGGTGFILSHSEVAEIRSSYPEEFRFLWPLINAQDVTSIPAQTPARSIINFSGMEIDDVRKLAPNLLAFIEERVRPHRAAAKSKIHREKWWLYFWPRPELYSRIKGLNLVVANPVVAKWTTFSLLPAHAVFSNALNVFPAEDQAFLAILQSTIHSEWAMTYGSSMKQDPRYNPSDCFETFPFPARWSDHEVLRNVGKEYLSHRSEVMTSRDEGLTMTYNRFHDPSESSLDIQKLRQLHLEMDQYVAVAYGWIDLDLGHGFHETNEGVRFTIFPDARREVLSRLLKLNQERYEDEVAQGLHGSTSTRSKARAPRERRASSADSAQPSFNFNDDAPTAQQSTDPAAAILNFLFSHIGWHAKTEVLATTGITDGQWNSAIAELIAAGKVERRGERRAAKYCLVGVEP